MPLYEILAPNGKKYRIEGPEGASQEDVARAVLAQSPEAGTPAPKTTPAGYVREALKGVPRGLVGGLEQAGLGLAALLPEETEKTAREKIKSIAESLKPSVAPGYEEAIPTKLGEAVGSVGSFLIPGLGAGRAAGMLGAGVAGARAAQLGTAGVLAPAAGAGEAREKAITEGATPEQIRTATQLGSLIGLTELAPIERMFRGLGKEVAEGLIGRVKNALVTGGFEGAQEAAAQIAQNLVAQQIYKPSQELLESAGESGAYGAGAGAIVQFLLDAATGRRAPRAAPTQPPEAAPTQPIPTTAQQPLFSPEQAPTPTAPQAAPRAYTPSGQLLTGERLAPEAPSEDLTADLESAVNVLGVAERDIARAKAQISQTQDPTERVRLFEALEPLEARRKAAQQQVNALRKRAGVPAPTVAPGQGEFAFGEEGPEIPRSLREARAFGATKPIPTTAQQLLFSPEQAPTPTAPQAAPRAYTPSGQLLTGERLAPEAPSEDLTADLESAVNVLGIAEREVARARTQISQTQDPTERVRLFKALEPLEARRKAAQQQVNALRKRAGVPAPEQAQRERDRKMGGLDFDAEPVEAPAPTPEFILTNSKLRDLGFKADSTRKAILRKLQGVDVSTPEGYARMEEAFRATKATPDEAKVADFKTRARRAFPPLPLQPTEGPRGRIEEPTIIGEPPAAPAVAPEVELDFIRQRYEAGLPLTPAEQYRLREAEKAAPTPELALPGQPAAPTQPLEVVENLPRQTPPLQLTQTQIPQPIEPTYPSAPMPAFVTEDALKSMGLAGRRDKAAVQLQEELLAKDLNDPADAQAVRDALRAYRDRTMTPKVTREKIDNYLRTIPEQRGFDFERVDSTDGQVGEPSVGVPVPQRAPRRPRAAEPRPADVDVPSGATEPSAQGAQPEPSALETPQEAPEPSIAPEVQAELRAYARSNAHAAVFDSNANTNSVQLYRKDLVDSLREIGLPDSAIQEAERIYDDYVEKAAQAKDIATSNAYTAIDQNADVEDYRGNVMDTLTDYGIREPEIVKAAVKLYADIVNKAAPTGNTVADITKSLKSAFRAGATFDRLTTVVQSEADVPAEIRKPGMRGAAYNGRVYLVADNIAPGEELGVLLHEAGAHIGFDKILTPQGRAQLATQVRQWAKGDDLKGRVAKEAIKKGRKSDDEIIAYTVEGLTNAGIKPTAAKSKEANWLRRVVDAMKRALKKLGLKQEVSPQELVDMAYGAAHIALEAGPSASDLGVRYSGVSTNNPVLDSFLVRREQELTRDGDRPWFTQLWDAITKSPAQYARKFAVDIVDNQYVAKRELEKADQWVPRMHMAFASRAGDIAASSLITGPIQLTTLGGGRGVQTFRVVDGTSIRDVMQSIEEVADLLPPGGSKGERFSTASKLFDAYSWVKRFDSFTPAMKAKYTIPPEIFAAGREADRLYGRQFRQALDDWTTYKNALLEAGRAAGRFSDEDVQAWKDAPDYVPWNRILEDAKHGYQTKSSARTFFSSLKAGGDMKSLVGGDIAERPIGSMLNNMQSLAFWLSTSAIKNHAASIVADTLGGNAFGGRSIADPNVPGVDKSRVIEVYDKGVKKYYELSDPLAAAAFMPIAEAAGPILKGLSSMTQLLRRGVTLMPGFVVNQLAQDSFRVATYSNVDRPFRAGSRVVGSFLGALRNDPLTQRLSQFGLEGQVDYLFPGQFGEKTRAARQLAPADPGLRTAVNKLVEKLEAFGHASDIAQREAVFKQTMEETGGDEALALFRAIEIINFQNRGRAKTASILRHTIPFFNAYLQGQNVAYRAMFQQGISGKDRQAALRQFYGTAAKIGAFSLLYAMLMADDDDYEKMSPNERMRGWLLPGSREQLKQLTGVDIGQNLMIPVPADPAGLIAKALPELFTTYIAYEGTASEIDGRKVLKAMGDGVAKAISAPNVVPQAIKPLVELGLNYSFFTGRAIVGKGQEGKEAFQQFTESTSELSKAIGEFANISPIKLDYFIRGTLGMFGSTLLYYGGAAYASAAGIQVPESRLSDNPQVRAFLAGREGGGQREDYYDLRDQIQRVIRTVNDLKISNPDKLQTYLEENKELYALGQTGLTGRVDEWVRKFRTHRQIIRSSNLSPEEKQRRLDELEKAELQLLANLNLATLRRAVNQ